MIIYDEAINEVATHTEALAQRICLHAAKNDNPRIVFVLHDAGAAKAAARLVHKAFTSVIDYGLPRAEIRRDVNVTADYEHRKRVITVHCTTLERAPDVLKGQPGNVPVSHRRVADDDAPVWSEVANGAPGALKQGPPRGRYF